MEMEKDWSGFVGDLSDEERAALLGELVGFMGIGDSAPVICKALDRTGREELAAHLEDE